MRKAAAVTLLVLAVLPASSTGPIPPRLPDGIPNPSRWEKVSGDVVVGNPAVRVQYEFYVNPRRPGLYELIRYRVSRADGTTTRELPGIEKMQWHAGADDMRRFACGPATGRGGCEWRPLTRDSDEFAREVRDILWVYGVHRRTLAARLAD